MISRFEQIIHASRDFITLVNRQYEYEFANEAYCKETGKSRQEIIGHTIAEIWGEKKFNDKIKKLIDHTFTGAETHDIDRFVWGDGYKYIHVAYYPYLENDEVTNVMIYSHDISIIKGLESRLIDYEFKDITTGLFNRKSFNIVLDMELEKARRSEQEKYRIVMTIRLRNLDEVNLQYSHEIGDLILESTGMRIKETLRASDLIFRFEGNEFIAILTNIKRLTDIAAVANKVWEKIALPYPNKTAVINMGCNIGFAVFPDDGSDKETLLKNSLSALNEAKQTDQRYIVYNRILHEKSVERFRTKGNIRKALLNDEFELHFQPIVDSECNVVGAETLIRWKHPELGYISPAYFIPIAEESGDVLMIGRWVIFKVCALISNWEAILHDRYVSINLSAHEFDSDTIVDEILGILDSFKQLKRKHLKVEITETQSVSNVESSMQKIQRLSDEGIGVFIDDFGAGYSSLGYLKILPAEVIKIDKTFVDNIENDPEDYQFLESLIGMIKSKKKKVLIEGVDTVGKYELLKIHAHIRFQGFLFSKGVDTETFEKILQSNTKLLPRE